MTVAEGGGSSYGGKRVGLRYILEFRPQDVLMMSSQRERVETKMTPSVLPLGTECLMVPFTEKGKMRGKAGLGDNIMSCFCICYI